MVVQPKEIAAESGMFHPSRRWPAEWEQQDAMWFAWPQNNRTWKSHFDPVPAAFVKLVHAVAEFLPVKVLAASGRLMTTAKKMLGSHVELFDVATNDCWVRDYGPTFVHDGDRVIGIDWRFNAWGGKYPPWDDDAAATRQICNLVGVVSESSPLTLEGGAIEGDGCGRLLTTPVCIETRTRNRGWSRERIARELHTRLGVTEIVWIDGGGLEGDDTDGHIDQLARFLSPTEVVVATSSKSDDPNATGLRHNLTQLQAWAEQTSPVVSVHALPTPPPRLINGLRMPESYCNFLMLGGSAIIAPTFAHRKSDSQAIGILQDLCPSTKVIGVDASEFIWGRGAWHCASQQQPSPPLRSDDLS